ncbi:MAG: biopolymer transporter ExbD [Chromatiaceae bacterium]|nr:biopolymer transporter ExbD [Chromatiaceae bacterium]
MNLRPRRRVNSDINLTPLIDVVFLLLIFFMVSTTFKDEARLRIQLPKAEGEPTPAEEPALIRVVIDASGALYIEDQRLVDREAATLARALRVAAGERRDAGVLIQADARTPHQSVMTALDAAAQAGLGRVAFAAARPDAPSGEAGAP